MTFAALLVIPMLIAAVCLTLGLRGRMVSLNPHCRHCGFDLVGTDTTGPAARCPECGADLAAPGSIIPGLRKRRRRLIVAGTIFLALAMAGGAAAGWGSVRGVNWNTVKPAWLLSREARTSAAPAAGAAMLELGTRLSAGRLDTDRAKSLLALALNHQADRAATWSVEWGDYLETCRRQGLMTPDQTESYARHAPTVSVDSRPTAAPGMRIPLRMSVGGARAPNNSSMRLSAHTIDASIGGRIVLRGGGGGAIGLGMLGSGSFGTLVDVPRDPGLHTITSRWKFAVIKVDDEEHPLATWEESFDVQVRVLAEGEPDVEVVEDESLRPGVERALKAQQSEILTTGSGLDAQGFIYSDSPPIALAYDVYWRSPESGEEWKMSSVAFANSGIQHGFGYRGSLPAGFGLSTVDIVLRPSSKAASETISIFKIWAGEVVIKGVPVK